MGLPGFKEKKTDPFFECNCWHLGRTPVKAVLRYLKSIFCKMLEGTYTAELVFFTIPTFKDWTKGSG